MQMHSTAALMQDSHHHILKAYTMRKSQLKLITSRDSAAPTPHPLQKLLNWEAATEVLRIKRLLLSGVMLSLRLPGL